jgi:Periplasmic binding protein
VTVSRRTLLGTLATATVLPPSRSRAEQERIRIGVLNDQSGLYRDFGGPTSVLAARMAVEDFGGNVFGRPIEVIDADHQNKADVASAIARGWFDRESVTAIADLTNSAVALAVQQLARERGKITPLTGPATTKCSPTGFHWWCRHGDALSNVPHRQPRRTHRDLAVIPRRSPPGEVLRSRIPARCVSFERGALPPPVSDLAHAGKR